MYSLMIGNNTQSIEPTSSSTNQIQSSGEAQTGFANVLKSTIEKTNEAQLQADLKTEALTNGDIQDLHNVMIAAQKASITLEATVQVQSKVIDAYNEIMRMQV